ncbi:MAG: flagellar biosynthetic protein FliO [Gammaproteobacteria bacterium]|nr:flagellar biosynthetic protein FliO [Gammaproteobacteria bacterium]MBU2058417.1 flagellar biosynthetic protein FliO [Gammaproteobacteria bacterium]MBU2176530.1 flagellar biosynthetic protein FliO [Gammaproteobacteria bacterium]MBU2248528.1 flagellar biosynthetic protein FliO [Gammaproteobacteria bacterium]MBU2345609.1 flagellar biosynthetic protein FliO [Gammaproteobacteria bacterium]
MRYCAGLLALTPLLSEATQNAAAVSPSASGNGMNAMTIMNVFGSLMLVLGLLFGLAWLYKKLAIKLPGSSHVKVITSVMLGPGERLLVIEVQGKQRVLGVTANQITMLFELDQPLVEDVTTTDWRTQFQTLLQKQKSKS